jgi:hypothetical protein
LDYRKSANTFARLQWKGCAVHDSFHLWTFGSCDSQTTVTADLRLVEELINEEITVPEVGGLVRLKPVVQTCFAYTAIVPMMASNGIDDKPDRGSCNDDRHHHMIRYKAVRRMRICNRSVPIAKHVEVLYASLDQEVLAVTLFHKLVIATQQNGIREAALLAQKWLLFFLNCVYLSAEDYQVTLDELNEKGINSFHDENHKLSSRMCYPNERLLNRDGGDLSMDDVLLAQGHENLCSVPLMIYLLLQCDALRKYKSSRHRIDATNDASCTRNNKSIDCRRGISIDLRVCAMLQMMSMTPNQLVRCIAPRIQVWESGENITEPFIDVMELKIDSIYAGVVEYCNSGMISQSTTSNMADLILLVDSSDHTVLLDGRYINIVDDNLNTIITDDADYNHHFVLHRNSLVVGIGLEKAVREASICYRSRPILINDIDQSSNNGRDTIKRLKDFLIEDTKCLLLASLTEGCSNFAQWKRYVANEVHR